MQASARKSSAEKFSKCGKLVLVIYVCFGYCLYIAASTPEAVLIKRDAKLPNNHEQKRNNEWTKLVLSNTNLSIVVKQNRLAFNNKQSLTNISNGLSTLFRNNSVQKERIFVNPYGYFSNHENHDTKQTQNSVFGYGGDVQNGYNIKGLNKGHETFSYPIHQTNDTRKKSQNYKSRKRENVRTSQVLPSTHVPHSKSLSTHPEFSTALSPQKQQRDER